MYSVNCMHMYSTCIGVAMFWTCPILTCTTVLVDQSWSVFETSFTASPCFTTHMHIHVHVQLQVHVLHMFKSLLTGAHYMYCTLRLESNKSSVVHVQYTYTTLYVMYMYALVVRSLYSFSGTICFCVLMHAAIVQYSTVHACTVHVRCMCTYMCVCVCIVRPWNMYSQC